MTLLSWDRCPPLLQGFFNEVSIVPWLLPHCPHPAGKHRVRALSANVYFLLFFLGASSCGAAVPRAPEPGVSHFSGGKRSKQAEERGL